MKIIWLIAIICKFNKWNEFFTDAQGANAEELQAKLQELSHLMEIGVCFFF